LRLAANVFSGEAIRPILDVDAIVHADQRTSNETTPGTGASPPPNKALGMLWKSKMGHRYAQHRRWSRAHGQENPRELLCGGLPGSTRAISPRQLPTDHDYAVSTREYQTDQPSRSPLGHHRCGAVLEHEPVQDRPSARAPWSKGPYARLRGLKGMMNKLT
jgi:hypothetical protein